MTLLACNTIVGLDRDYELDSDADVADPAKEAGLSDGGTSSVEDGQVVDPVEDDPPDVGPEDVWGTHCGPTTAQCARETETCCALKSGGYHCKTTADCKCVEQGSCPGLHLDCDDDTDCSPGKVCCGVLSSDLYALDRATCELTENCTGARDIQLCALGRPHCANGKTCKVFKDDLYPGIGRCQ